MFVDYQPRLCESLHRDFMHRYIMRSIELRCQPIKFNAVCSRASSLHSSGVTSVENVLHGTTTLELYESVNIAAKECWSSDTTCYCTCDAQNMMFATNIKSPRKSSQDGVQKKSSKVSTPFSTHFQNLCLIWSAVVLKKKTSLSGSQLLTYVCRQNVILPGMMVTVSYICTCHTCANDGSHNQISLHN